MEEDIKILEELLQGAKDNNMYEYNKYFYSIENLIKGYRELEEKNKLMNVRIKTRLHIAQEEYKEFNERGQHQLALVRSEEIGVLQELMEEK